jgi:hypothetical protein
MAIQSFRPSGGGSGALSYIGAVYMSTYNRSWAQAGAAGNYAVYSQNQEFGYAYFIGSGMTTGISLNKMAAVSHAFTRIDIVGTAGDIVSLYKAQVKATTVYSGALQAFPYTTAATKSVQTLTTSGTYTHSTAAGILGLVNVILVGGGGASGGGHGAAHAGGGGGGGGNVVILNAIPVAATTDIVVGANGVYPTGVTNKTGGNGGTTYFGNLYAIGGGGGGGWDSRPGIAGGNGGGGGGESSAGTGGKGTVQTASQGLDISGSVGFYGGRAGGQGNSAASTSSRGGGGGGALGDGSGGGNGSGGDGGLGYATTFSGTNTMLGAGGYATSYAAGNGIDRRSGYTASYGCGGQGSGGEAAGQTGVNGQPGVILVGVYTL